MSVSLTLIKSATQASDPVADSAAFPANVGDTDRYVDAGQIKGFIPVTVTVTDAAYVHSQRELIIIDDAGDNTDVDITLAAALSASQELIVFAEDGGAASHSVILGSSQTWDGTNQTAVFNAAGDYISVIAVSATRVVILANNGVTFSA